MNIRFDCTILASNRIIMGYVSCIHVFIEFIFPDVFTKTIFLLLTVATACIVAHLLLLFKVNLSNKLYFD